MLLTLILGCRFITLLPLARPVCCHSPESTLSRRWWHQCSQHHRYELESIRGRFACYARESIKCYKGLCKPAEMGMPGVRVNHVCMLDGSHWVCLTSDGLEGVYTGAPTN